MVNPRRMPRCKRCSHHVAIVTSIQGRTAVHIRPDSFRFRSTGSSFQFWSRPHIPQLRSTWFILLSGLDASPSSGDSVGYFLNTSSSGFPSRSRFQRVPYLMPSMSAHSGSKCVSPFHVIGLTFLLFLCCSSKVIHRQFSGQ